MHRPRVGVCLVCWTTRGEGGSLRCSMGQVTWEEGGTGAIPGRASHCCSAHMTSQREIPERRWQLHENGLPCCLCVPRPTGNT